jgi:hypothetical protein
MKASRKVESKKEIHAAVVYPLRVQGIRRRGRTPTLYVYFPLPLAAAIGLEVGETVQWELLDRGELHLIRVQPSAPRARGRSSPR